MFNFHLAFSFCLLRLPPSSFGLFKLDLEGMNGHQLMCVMIQLNL